MNRRKLFREKSAISPIVATLLLIIIGIAAGIVLYAYVSGFIGSSTQNSGFGQEDVSIDAACVSVGSGTGGTGCNSGAYYIVIRNLGNTLTYSASSTASVQIYFTDSATSATGSTTCSLTGVTISTGGSKTCSGVSPLPSSFTPISAGDNMVIKIVMPNGGATTYTVKALP